MRLSVNAVFVSVGSARIIAEADRDGNLHFANLPALRPYSIFALAADRSGLTALSRISSKIRATLICCIGSGVPYKSSS